MQIAQPAPQQFGVPVRQPAQQYQATYVPPTAPVSQPQAANFPEYEAPSQVSVSRQPLVSPEEWTRLVEQHKQANPEQFYVPPAPAPAEPRMSSEQWAQWTEQYRKRQEEQQELSRQTGTSMRSLGILVVPPFAVHAESQRQQVIAQQNELFRQQRQAELRRQEDLRQAELRRQEDMQLANRGAPGVTEPNDEGEPPS